MLEATVGETVLRQGLSSYLKKHAYDNAITQDLWEAISEAWEQQGGTTAKGQEDATFTVSDFLSLKPCPFLSEPTEFLG